MRRLRRAAGVLRVEVRRGPAQWLHAPWPAAELRDRRLAAICWVSRPALVVAASARPGLPRMGRTREAVPFEVVQRPSGGGGVWVEPAGQVWLEIWLPPSDPLWRADILESAWVVGQVWRDALKALGAPRLAVHQGRAVRDPLADLVCFAGRGPGEVVVAAGPGTGRKVVGISQRRTQQGVRLQTMAPWSWRPGPLLEALASLGVLEESRASRLLEQLQVRATGLEALGLELGPDPLRTVARAFLAQLGRR